MSDSKSTREAELEELRRQSLAQNNAQKLAESASTPINMLDWQAQQKALKDQERMSKTQTAEFLHQYRRTGGNMDADLADTNKLSSYKQEDRKNKEEAARYLHSYRGTADVGVSGSPTPRANRTSAAPGLVQNDPVVDQRSGEESVATLAAGFSENGSSGLQPENIPGQHQHWQYQDRSITESVMVDGTEPTLDVLATEAATATAFAPFETGTTAPPPPPPVVSPALPTSLEGTASTRTATDESNKQKAAATPDDDDWVSVESSTVPSPEKIEQDAAAAAAEPTTPDAPQTETANSGSFDSEEDAVSRAVTEAAGNLDEDILLDDDENTVMTEAHLHASFSGGGHVSLRLDVEFSFGLVSNDIVPNTDKYMKAVAFIAGSLFAESRPAGTGGHAIYNPDFEPFVRVVEDDNTFSGKTAKRFMVHASLPMFIINWAEATSTREGIKDVLRNAIQDGSFLRLALESS